MIEAVPCSLYKMGSIREEVDESMWSIQVDGSVAHFFSCISIKTCVHGFSWAYGESGVPQTLVFSLSSFPIELRKREEEN